MALKKYIQIFFKKMVVMLFLLFNFLLAFSPFVNASVISKITGKDITVQTHLSDWEENNVNKQAQNCSVHVQVKNKQKQVAENVNNPSAAYLSIFNNISIPIDNGFRHRPAYYHHLSLYHLF